ncbi:hypothetical protein ALC60_11547 [Trachymyrmex zeteki]|uniref:Uncharacterized protein n=1 Tax=Mycetomoellerius zeteki TaxID=64791 RepID=A0A151WNS6_9HYME|nr:hypothetical protein ALC60_11547 [Trachymyrmex zeteki]
MHFRRLVEKHRSVVSVMRPLDTSVKTADCLECTRKESIDAIVDGSYANHDGGDRKLPRRSARARARAKPDGLFPNVGKYVYDI